MAYGTNAPFGLRPLQSINGGSWTEKTNEYNIYASADGATTYGTSLFTGDPVVLSPTLAQAGTLAQYLPAFTDGTPSTWSALPVLGVFMGCEYFDALNRLTKSSFWPGATPVYPGTLIKAWVIDDPTVVYDVQVSTRTNVINDAYFPTPATTADYAGVFGRNFALDIAANDFGDPQYANNPGRGNALSGQSGFYLCASTAEDATHFTHDYNHTVATLPLKVIGYTLNPQNVPKPGQTYRTTPFLNVRAMLNNHVYGGCHTPGTTLA